MSLVRKVFNFYSVIGVPPSKLAESDARPVSRSEFDDSIAALVDSGYQLKDKGQLDDALLTLQSALLRDPRNCAVLNALGLVFVDLAQPEEALRHFDEALRIDPWHVSSLCNSAAVLTSLGEMNQAVTNCEKALSINPNLEPAWSELAHAYSKLGRHQEAVSISNRVVRDDPNRIQLRRNRAVILQEAERFEDALEDFKAIVALDPTDPQASLSLAVVALLCGDFHTGWQAHEARWKLPGVRSFSGHRLQSQWDGKRDLVGRTVFLYAEQGYGDTIQFSRYCRMVKARGARVLLGVQAPLRPLFKNLDGVDQLVLEHQQLPAFDEHSSLMSLPLAFDTHLSTIPEHRPALFASPEKMAVWQQRMGQARRLRVAVAWRGNPKHSSDLTRSIPLESFEPLFSLPIDFIAMCIGVTEHERSLLRNWPNVRDLSSHIVDFEDSAALIACCDLVISVDSAPAHLAGAMAKPCWILIAQPPDWRWLLARTDSPWYPSVRLYRQSRRGDWRTVLDEMGGDLSQLSEKRSLMM